MTASNKLQQMDSALLHKIIVCIAFLMDLSFALCYFLATSVTCQIHQNFSIDLFYDDAKIYFESDKLPKLVKNLNKELYESYSLTHNSRES